MAEIVYARTGGSVGRSFRIAWIQKTYICPIKKICV